MKNRQIATMLGAILSMLACFGLLPRAQAVSPPPDGCYPNFTTAEGCSALNSVTTGPGNTALGWYALFGDTTGGFNTGVGGGALALNNADSNTAVGAGAMLLNTSGYENVAVGTNSLVFNDSGFRNTAVGAFSLTNNVDGSENSALGRCALLNNITAVGNTGIGAFALLSNDSSGKGTAISNTAVGDAALMNNVDGDSNTAVGFHAFQNTTGNFNTGLGAEVGNDNATGTNDIYIGDTGFPDESNVIAIGGFPASGTPYEACFIGGIAGVGILMADAVPVYIDTTTGQLGTMLIPNGNKSTAPVRRGAHRQASIKEFQKQQKKIAELEATVKRLAATVKKQAAQIEKVSAQVQMSRPAPRVVKNP